MTPEQFVYWLQGYMELTDEVVENHSLTFEQVLVIKDHLNKVFNRTNPTVTCSVGQPLLDKQPYRGKVENLGTTWDPEKRCWVTSDGKIVESPNSNTILDWNHFYGSC